MDAPTTDPTIVPTTTPSLTHPLSSEAAKQLCIDSMFMMASGDLSEFQRIVHPLAVNHEAKDEPPAASEPGPNGFYATALWLREAFADLSFELHHAIAEGDLVVVHNTMRGRHTGAMVEYQHGEVATVFPPTGRTFASTQTHWFRVADGMVIEHWANRDDIGTAQQLGWIPPTPRYLLRMASARRRARRQLAKATRRMPDRPTPPAPDGGDAAPPRRTDQPPMKRAAGVAMLAMLAAPFGLLTGCSDDANAESPTTLSRDTWIDTVNEICVDHNDALANVIGPLFVDGPPSDERAQAALDEIVQRTRAVTDRIDELAEPSALTIHVATLLAALDAGSDEAESLGGPAFFAATHVDPFRPAADIAGDLGLEACDTEG